jgi:two-component system, probable response regulator PhcQ
LFDYLLVTQGIKPGGIEMEETLLIVDDEQSVISALVRSLDDEGYEISTANSGDEGLKLLKSQRFKVVISDERMPGMSGSEFLAAVREKQPETVRIMLTGHASLESTMAAVNSGEIYRFFIKPWNDHELLLAIRSAMEKYNLEAENRRLLSKIKEQALTLKVTEMIHPGITHIEKDDQGNLLLPDFSDCEIAEMIKSFEEEHGSQE